MPGCFKPGEAERAAELLGIAFETFVRQSLAVAEVCDSGVDGLRPKQVRRGHCIFLTPLGRCAIHDAKPFECRAAWCGDGSVDRTKAAYHQVADAWNRPEPQRQLVQLRRVILSPRAPEKAAGNLSAVSP